MTAPEPPLSARPRRDSLSSWLPAALMALVFFALAGIVWPPNLERLISLHWLIGDLSRAAWLLSLLLGLLGVLSILVRRIINAAYGFVFPTVRRLLVSMVLVAGSTFATASLVELALWKLHLPFSGDWVASETALARFDPEIGWSYIPNQSVVQKFGLAQREVPMFFDNIGARVGAPGTRHSPTAPTVIVVGCSVTMGHGLPWDETFAGRLEAMPGFPLQVVNLGVQAYGTDQSLLLLRRHIRDFNTKAVVYTFIDDHVTRNVNDDRRLLYPKGKFLGTKPVFGLADDGSLILRKPPHRYQDRWESHIWSYARLEWTLWGPAPDGAVTRALVHEMRSLVEVNGATFIVIRWPESRFSFDDPGLQEIDLSSMVPPEWNEWIIPVDRHPDARAAAFVASVLAEKLKNIVHVGTGELTALR